MKTKLVLLSVLLLTAVLALTLTASAAIPHLMNFQGKATDKSGVPLNGTYNLTFRIYNTETGGTPKWTETQTNVQITNGIFQVQLGSATPLNLPFDESYWISVEINNDGEMFPRTRLASVGYAYAAETSNNNIPTGVIMAWATDTPPDGWLVCDGRAVSRATYARLFSTIGSTYGAGDGSITFNLPNMQGRIPVGKSGEPEFNALGQRGGEKTHTLTIAEMPAHTHDGWIGADGGSYHAKANFYSNTHYLPDAADVVANRGGDGAHNNLQPYITLNYIIKI